MDLSTMETKLEADQYTTPEESIKDAKLIFDNCRRYNNESRPENRQLKALRAELGPVHRKTRCDTPPLCHA
ncbi:hypothetical protein F4780DRAFT_749975 [Xylariomycetidae sp. FL0641]|nr:hypothetical protein F4780DRAFT_749975 [Xylariomycetidae sp. FL0641]